MASAACRNRSGAGLPRPTSSALKMAFSGNQRRSPVNCRLRRIFAWLPLEATHSGPSSAAKAVSIPVSGRRLYTKTRAVWLRRRLTKLSGTLPPSISSITPTQAPMLSPVNLWVDSSRLIATPSSRICSCNTWFASGSESTRTPSQSKIRSELTPRQSASGWDSGVARRNASNSRQAALMRVIVGKTDRSQPKRSAL